MEKEPVYQSMLKLAGNDGQETGKKMFQLRLIEIKLMEGKQCGFHSLANKLKKDESQSYQDYLSEAFRGHPDLG